MVYLGCHDVNDRRSSDISRALIADLDSSYRRNLALDFERLGFKVFMTDDGEFAFEFSHQQQPNFVVLELKLNRGSGMDLLHRLRSELPHIPTIVLTSYASVATAVRATRLGSAGYLSKPATAEQIMAALSESRDEETQTARQADEIRTMTLDRAIWEYIHQTMETAGTIAETARRLGVTRQSLRRMISKYAPIA